jgi:hypothetical protein
MLRRVLALALTAGLLFGGAAPTFASESTDSPVSLLGKGKGKAGKKGKKGKGKKGKKGSKKPAGKGKKVSTATVV